MSASSFEPLRTLGYFPSKTEEAIHQMRSDYKKPDEIEFEFEDSQKYWVWIERHQNPLKTALEDMIANIQHINFADFTRSLGESIEDIHSRLKQSHGKGFDFSKHTIVLVEGNKSNKWVAEIALKQFGVLASAYIRLGEKDGRSFIQYCDTLSKNQLKDLLQGKSLILFDDGSYSGKQLADHLSNIKNYVSKNNLGVKNICAIVPYMTPLSERVVANAYETVRSKTPLLLSAHKMIPTLDSLQRNSRDAVMHSWYRQNDVDPGALGLVWFDHKLPNGQSFPEPLARGSIFTVDGKSIGSLSFFPEITPPYKTGQ